MSPASQGPRALSSVIWKMKLPGRENKTAMVLGTTTCGSGDAQTEGVCAAYEQWECIRVLLARGNNVASSQLVPGVPRGCGPLLLSGPREAFRQGQETCTASANPTASTESSSTPEANQQAFTAKPDPSSSCLLLKRF
ncbi:large ribosomal subunit protein eL18-like [Tamandua tetradactyla]|uniref:large ribosomal subunit protein eL18-like n=1 Tax=Tamandua tetradactyla TaxID=48850 RepID=UPI004054729A